MATNWPISAKEDSVVICKLGTISSGSDPLKREKMSYVDFLSEFTLYSTGNRIIDCRTNTDIKPLFYSYALSYKNKRLIITTHYRFFVFNEKNKMLLPKEVPAYEEEVYAENGVLKKGLPKIILEAPESRQSTVKYANEVFDKKVKSGSSTGNVSLMNALLAAALHKDEISRERLLNFTKKFPLNTEDQESFKEHLRLLQDFEAKKTQAKQ